MANNKNIIIVVDMQNDFITGSLGSNEAESIIPTVSSIINNEKSKGSRIIFTKDTHYDNYLDTHEGQLLKVPHCIKDTEGWNICSELDTEGDNTFIIEKNSFGYDKWKESGLITDEYNCIILVGLCTDICVISNALILRALYPEKNIIIDIDATAGTDLKNKASALRVAKCCQVDVYPYSYCKGYWKR